jgi:intracellular multiplication protein IcmE
MSKLQADVGRHSKVVATGIIVGVAAIAYVALTYSTASSAKRSEIGAIQTAHTVPSTESEHYGEVLDRYNRKNASAAAQTGGSYLSVLSSKPQSLPEAAASQQQMQPQPAPMQALPSQVSPQYAGPQTQPQTVATDSKQHERIVEQAQGLMTNWTPTQHSAARVSEVADYTKSMAPTSVIAQQVTPAGVAPSQQRIIPDFALIPAILDTDIDTDESSIVSAYFPSGDYAGATVFAMGYRRLNNTVDINFSAMEWKGHSYKINAKAIDQNTMRSALSGEVNNHYLSRILLPAIALGLGRAGQLFEHSDSETVVSPFGSVIQTQSGPPGGRVIAGTIVGGAATESGQVLKHDASQMPIKQVLVPRNETIGVRFLEPVLASSEIVPQVSSATALLPQNQEQTRSGLPITGQAR